MRLNVIRIGIGLQTLFGSTLFAADANSYQQLAKLQVLPLTAPSPKDNPTTPAKVELGRQLFFDPRMSKDGSVSCNSCHNVMGSGTDNRAGSVGISGQVGGRSSPTVFNAAFLSVQFWDGRAATLEDQAKGPLTNPIEMGMPNHDTVVARIKEIDGYKPLFAKAFGPGDTINIDNFAKAVAAYERTLITPNSPFDKFASGNSKAISADAQIGYTKFVETGCTSCHSGPAFAGPQLPTGTGFYQKFPTFTESEFVKKYDLLADDGRKKATNQEGDGHMFRVPTLRNVAMTAPYFHNGKVASLDEAIRVMAKTQLNKDLTDKDVSEIFAFLTTLTGQIPEQKMPRLAATTGRTLTPAQ